VRARWSRRPLPLAEYTEAALALILIWVMRMAVNVGLVLASPILVVERVGVEGRHLCRFFCAKKSSSSVD
jgi:hypothetical protein